MTRFIGIGNTSKLGAKRMSDLITPVILLTFGGATAVVLAGFYILFHRSPRSPFKTEGYANYARNFPPRSGSVNPFRRGPNMRRGPNRRAIFTIILLLLLIAGAVASTLSDAIDILLLLVFLTPFVFGLLRSRRRERDEEGHYDDERRRSA